MKNFLVSIILLTSLINLSGCTDSPQQTQADNQTKIPTNQEQARLIAAPTASAIVTISATPTVSVLKTPSSPFSPVVNSVPKSTPTNPTSQSLPADNTYTNLNGHEVQRPTYSESVPAGASARCGDGTYSFSENRKGTCSHHGGVNSWL